MPWETPTLREVRTLVRDNVRASLPGADANVPNSVLRVLSDSQGALCHLTLQYVDWLALQLLPDTAETEWLDRHGEIWLVNADGSRGRKEATLSQGSVSFTGQPGLVVPANSLLDYAVVDLSFETLEDATLGDAPAVVPIRALDPGSYGNLVAGTRLALRSPPDGVDHQATVGPLDLYGGTDTETDEDLRARVLRRIRQPPMGGAQYDYEAWALAVPGVSKAWAVGNEMGIGTATVRFLMDETLRPPDGWPTQEDINAVADYIDQKRPVTVKDCYVVAPIRQHIDIDITELVPDEDETKFEIEASIRAMLKDRAAPGQTIYAAWVSFAIMNAPSVISFRLVTTTDYVMASPGHMAVLGTISYV
jgi:uncharacterized phage protein gp47/JayE